MSTQIFKQMNVICKAFDFIEYAVDFPNDFAVAVINAYQQTGDPDPDLYYKADLPPTKTLFDNCSLLTGLSEQLVVNNVAKGTHYIAINIFKGTGTINITINCQTAAELIPPEPIDNTDDEIHDDLGGTIGDVQTGVNGVTVTINNDYSGLAQAIIQLQSIVNTAISDSISGQAQNINNSFNDIASLHSTELDTFKNGLELSYSNSANTIKNGVTELGNDLDISLKDLGRTVNKGMFDSAEAITSKLLDPMTLSFKDIADNIKGISSGKIDDILDSIFEKVG